MYIHTTCMISYDGIGMVCTYNTSMYLCFRYLPVWSLSFWRPRSGYDRDMIEIWSGYDRDMIGIWSGYDRDAIVKDRDFSFTIVNDRDLSITIINDRYWIVIDRDQFLFCVNRGSSWVTIFASVVSNLTDGGEVRGESFLSVIIHLTAYLWSPTF